MDPLTMTTRPTSKCLLPLIPIPLVLSLVSRVKAYVYTKE